MYGGDIEPLEPLYRDEGKLVPVIDGDDVTADGLLMWEESPPLYHDLTTSSYLHFDVQEWSSRLKKYKSEAIAQAERITRLKPEVEALRAELETHSGQFADLSVAVADSHAEKVKLQEATKEQKFRREVIQQNLTVLRQEKFNIGKAIEVGEKEVAHFTDRIGLLKQEVDGNRRRHEQALGEKEKLHLERRWFFRERVLLEETSALESEDSFKLMERLQKLRHSMHRMWKETKDTDVRGHLRATKLPVGQPGWYAARTRRFVRSGHGTYRDQHSEDANSEGGDVPLQ